MYSSIGRGLLNERPIILFDSHPELQGGIVRESLNRFAKHLSIAWTGDVVFDVQSGNIRLQWYTTDNKFGKKDYEMREHDDARQGFETLCTLPDVSRCMIVGFASQNPYSLFGESAWAVQEREKQKLFEAERYRDFVPREKKGPTVSQRIEDILAEDERKPKERKQYDAQDV